MPVILLPRVLFSLLSLALLAAAAYLLWSWGHGGYVRDDAGVLQHVHGPTWRLYTGLGLGGWSFLGRAVVMGLLPQGADDPREERGEARTVTAPDGSVLHVESVGAGAGPTLVLTHGWGLNSTAWYYAKRALGERHRLVMWDLPGLGRSKPPADGRYTLDRLAEALGAVVASVEGGGPVVLVGHSIGGMTTQTLWRACPEAVKRRVAGMVLIDTTYEDPIQTMWLRPVWQALRVPLIQPLLWLMILLSPLVWLSNWQSYLSGSSLIATRLTGFGRHGTRGQIDFSARLGTKGSPGVQAKGDLAMLHWSAAEVAPTITVPVLLLVGTKDIVTLPVASDTIAAAAPHARVVRVEGAGHMGLLERSGAYNEAIAAFVAELTSPNAPRSAATA